jgi:hypothetical protein
VKEVEDMVMIRKKRFVGKTSVCRLCGANPKGDPEVERTVCSCPWECFDPTWLMKPTEMREEVEIGDLYYSDVEYGSLPQA